MVWPPFTNIPVGAHQQIVIYFFAPKIIGLFHRNSVFFHEHITFHVLKLCHKVILYHINRVWRVFLPQPQMCVELAWICKRRRREPKFSAPLLGRGYAAAYGVGDAQHSVEAGLAPS